MVPYLVWVLKGGGGGPYVPVIYPVQPKCPYFKGGKGLPLDTNEPGASGIGFGARGLGFGQAPRETLLHLGFRVWGLGFVVVRLL